jgi:hypothetical protein
VFTRCPIDRVLLEEPDLDLDRIESHTEENFIGSAHSICHGDNRLDDIQHQMVRFEFARSRLSVLGVESKIAKRVNLGGISIVRSDRVEMLLEGTSAFFAAEFLNFSGTKDWVICGGAPEFHSSCGFIDQIWMLMHLVSFDARFSRVHLWNVDSEPLYYLQRQPWSTWPSRAASVQTWPLEH